jgi:hypothetical protein
LGILAHLFEDLSVYPLIPQPSLRGELLLELLLQIHSLPLFLQRLLPPYLPKNFFLDIEYLLIERLIEIDIVALRLRRGIEGPIEIEHLKALGNLEIIVYLLPIQRLLDPLQLLSHLLEVLVEEVLPCRLF